MRIIAGEFRGRPIVGPEGNQTRPVTDRAKQSIFDMLGDVFVGAPVYDFFAGTGSFGLEALSRGASHATFFESHRPTVNLLRQNIANLELAGRATVVTTDAFAWRGETGSSAGLVSLDPPYRFVRHRPDELRELSERLAAIMAPSGVLVFRHDPADRLALPGLLLTCQKEYGHMAVDFYQARHSGRGKEVG